MFYLFLLTFLTFLIRAFKLSFYQDMLGTNGKGKLTKRAFACFGEIRTQLLLFNDMLMLVKDKGESRLSYKAHINFEDQVNFSEAMPRRLSICYCIGGTFASCCPSYLHIR